MERNQVDNELMNNENELPEQTQVKKKLLLNKRTMGMLVMSDTKLGKIWGGGDEGGNHSGGSPYCQGSIEP